MLHSIKMQKENGTLQDCELSESALEVLGNEGDAKARSYKCSILHFHFMVSWIEVEFAQYFNPHCISIIFSNQKTCDLVAGSHKNEWLVQQF